MRKIASAELRTRLKRFKTHMDIENPDWKMAVIFSKINQYYFTGTMQEGMLIIPRDEEATFWVRRSYERALDESLFPNIRSMHSFRDAAKEEKNIPSTVYIETEKVPLALYQRFLKHFPFHNFKSVDADLAIIRTNKSYYELSRMRKAGKIHQHVLEDLVPELLHEGMSEAELAANLFSALIENGSHGVTRFGMFDTEMIIGQICFGESSIYPSYFNGAGGGYGMGPAVPLIGSRKRKLERGDLVYIDVGCGVDGYNTDKTTTYMFKESIAPHALEIHEKCVEIQNQIASMLKPGAVPSEIYNEIINSLDSDFLENFMGYGNRKVRFLGHGIGLLIDEWPVIANGFDQPLQKGMALAIEPKHGIKNIGMVGIENTFIVTGNGGDCITGKNPGLIPVF
ncbi:MAG: Xaa-Pro peptidase family protein [Methanobacteriaceae archaeon]|nr:Xaa-Pro peptidase family protein [Methanobacteriaceae archaeon]